MVIQSRWFLGSIGALILCGLAVGPLEAASSYFLVDLGYLNPTAPGGSFASGINNSGQVVGTAWNGVTDEAFVWNGITMVGLSTLSPDGSGWSRANGINNSGHVAGAAWNGSNTEAFLWNGSTMTGLGDFCTDVYINCPHYSVALALNDKDQVVGGASGHPPPYVAFLWEGGTMVVQGPGADSYAFGINNSGWLVGSFWFSHDYPFLSDGTGWIILPHYDPPDWPLPGEHLSGFAYDINDRGQVVGWNESYVVLWEDGTVVPLFLSRRCSYFPALLRINNGGQVVGTDDCGSNPSGFLWDGSVHYLTGLLDGSAVGWTITGAAAINDRGQIAATAVGSDGLSHAVRLDPTTLLFIDIRPGDNANKINLKSKGKLTVAILATPAFNAFTQIDQVSLTFGRSGDEPSLAFCDFTPEDVNGDGLPDLVCHFYTEATGFHSGNTQGVMKGKSKSGVLMAGSDAIRIARAR